MANNGGRLSFIPSEYFGLSALGQELSQFGQFLQDKKERDRQYELQVKRDDRDQDRLEREIFNSDRDFAFATTAEAAAGLDPIQRVKFFQDNLDILQGVDIELSAQDRLAEQTAVRRLRGLEYAEMMEAGEELEPFQELLAFQAGGMDPLTGQFATLNEQEIEAGNRRAADDAIFRAAYAAENGLEVGPDTAMVLSQLETEGVRRTNIRAATEAARLNARITRAEFQEWQDFGREYGRRRAEGELELLEGQIGAAKMAALESLPPELRQHAALVGEVQDEMIFEGELSVEDRVAIEDIGRYRMLGTLGDPEKDAAIETVLGKFSEARRAQTEAAKAAVATEQWEKMVQMFAPLYENEDIDEGQFFEVFRQYVNSNELIGADGNLVRAVVTHQPGFLGFGGGATIQIGSVTVPLDDMEDALESEITGRTPGDLGVAGEGMVMQPEEVDRVAQAFISEGSATDLLEVYNADPAGFRESARLPEPQMNAVMDRVREYAQAEGDPDVEVPPVAQQNAVEDAVARRQLALEGFSAGASEAAGFSIGTQLGGAGRPLPFVQNFLDRAATMATEYGADVGEGLVRGAQELVGGETDAQAREAVRRVLSEKDANGATIFNRLTDALSGTAIEQASRLERTSERAAQDIANLPAIGQGVLADAERYLNTRQKSELQRRINYYNRLTSEYIGLVEQTMFAPNQQQLDRVSEVAALIRQLGGNVPSKVDGAWVR